MCGSRRAKNPKKKRSGRVRARINFVTSQQVQKRNNGRKSVVLGRHSPKSCFRMSNRQADNTFLPVGVSINTIPSPPSKKKPSSIHHRRRVDIYCEKRYILMSTRLHDKNDQIDRRKNQTEKIGGCGVAHPS